MHTKRAFGVAVAMAATMTVAAGAAGAFPELMDTTVKRWEELKAEPAEGGAVRAYFNAPTSTLLRLGMRARTLEPGGTPHPTRPHSRPVEQLVIVKQGTLELQLDQEKQRLEAGSAVFLAPNQWHALRNPGSQPVTFYEIDWVSPGMNGERQY